MSSLFGTAVEEEGEQSTKQLSEKTAGGTVAMTTSTPVIVASSPDSRLGDRTMTMLEEDEELYENESTDTRDISRYQSDAGSVVSSATDATPVDQQYPPGPSTLPPNRQMQSGINPTTPSIPSQKNPPPKNLLSKLFSSMNEEGDGLPDEEGPQQQQQRQQRRTLDGPPTQKAPQSLSSDISVPSPGHAAAAAKRLQRRDSRRNRSTLGGFEETTTSTINKANDHLKLAFSTGGTPKTKPSDDSLARQRDTIVSTLMYDSNENSDDDDDGNGDDQEDNQVRPISRFPSSSDSDEAGDSKGSDGSDDDSFAISAVTGATTFSDIHNPTVPELRRLSVLRSSQKREFDFDSPQPAPQLQLRRLSTLMATSSQKSSDGTRNGLGNDVTTPDPNLNLPSPSPKQELRRLSALVASKKEEVRRLSKLVASQKSNISQKSNNADSSPPQLTLRRLSTLTASQKNIDNNPVCHDEKQPPPSSQTIAALAPPSQLLSKLFSAFEDDDMDMEEEPSHAYASKPSPHTSPTLTPTPTPVLAPSATTVGSSPGMPDVPIWLQQQQQQQHKDHGIGQQRDDGDPTPIWFTSNTSSNSHHNPTHSSHHQNDNLYHNDGSSGKSQSSPLARSGPLVTTNTNPFKGLVYANIDEPDPVLSPYVPTPISKANTPISTPRLAAGPRPRSGAGPRSGSGSGLSPSTPVKTARSRPTTGTPVEDPHLSPSASSPAYAGTTTSGAGTTISSRPTTTDPTTTSSVAVTPTLAKAQTALLRKMPRVRTPVAAAAAATTSTPAPSAPTTSTSTSCGDGTNVDGSLGGGAEHTEIKLRRRRL